MEYLLILQFPATKVSYKLVALSDEKRHHEVYSRYYLSVTISFAKESGTLLTRVSQVGFSCDALQAFIDSARYSEAVLLAPAAISGDQFRAHWRSPPAPTQLQVTRDPLELPELKKQVDDLMAGIALLSQPEDQVWCRVLSLLAVASSRR